MPVMVKDVMVTAKRQLHHGDSYGYRLERGGLAMVYSTDSEHKLDDAAGRAAFVEFFRDADLVIWDPEALFEVDPMKLHHRHKLTPYAGRTLHGVVRRTLLRGETVYDNGQFPEPPSGRLLRQGEE